MKRFIYSLFFTFTAFLSLSACTSWDYDNGPQTPVITAQPQDADYSINDANNQPLSIAVDLSDGGKLTYQWYRNAENSNADGIPIAGAADAYYNPPTDIAETVYYYVVVTNTNGGLSASTASEAAKITVEIQAPIITVQPRGAIYPTDYFAVPLEVTASSPDGGVLSYQWFRVPDTPVGTDETFSPPTSDNGVFAYYVAVTNNNGGKTASTASEFALITVANETPEINISSSSLADAEYYKSDTATPLSVSASAEPSGTALTYQWYKNSDRNNWGGTRIEGETNSTFIPPVNDFGTLYYYVVIGNSDYSELTATSEAVKITVKIRAPVINTQPADTAYPTGIIPSPKLVVAATSPDGVQLTYQWYSTIIADDNTNGTPISGAEAADCAPSTAAVGNFYYYVTVTNAFNGEITAGTTSRTAQVTVADATPQITAQPLDADYNKAELYPGDLAVTAVVYPAATLNYQWYRSSDGSNWAKIDGAANSSYTPDTSDFGTFYYYVKVTNFDYPELTATSRTARIEVVNLITDESSLSDVKNALSEPYKLANDIILNSSSSWSPIEDAGTYFTGTFNGNGKTISGLYINESSKDYVGLFGCLSAGAVIDNLTLELSSAGITGKSYVGGIAGCADGTADNPVKLTNTHVKGNIITATGATANRYVGGLVGHAESYVLIDGSSNAADLSGDINTSNADVHYGGIIGFAASSNIISGSRNSGAIAVANNTSSNKTIYIGGLLGYSGSTEASAPNAISGGANSGVLSVTVTGSNTEKVVTGGIAGSLTDYDTVTASHNTGTIYAYAGNKHNAYAGGITGEGGTIANSSNTGDGNILANGLNAYAGGISGRFAANNKGSVVRSYNTATVVAVGNGNAGVGGIVGDADGSGSSGNILNSYNSGNILGTGNTSTHVGGIAGNQRHGIISGNYNVGDVYGLTASMSTISAAGITGYMYATLVISNNAVINAWILSNSSNATINRVLASTSTSGMSDGVTNNFVFEGMMDKDTFEQNQTVQYGTSKTISELTDQTTYSNAVNNGGLGWSFGSSDNYPWKMSTDPNYPYPILYWQKEGEIP
ncbi:MAG: hypothetical protein LBD73_06605 [Deferribacteraceae bacterium]|jgi:hypothetical protein|nr:hypothetical protein [Deferribacteraceae bacterium]